MLRLLVILFLLASSITPVIAQSDETEAWSIVERCVDEPIAPHEDWSFEGIIFLKSNIGIHGLNSFLETPYIIAYRNEESFAYNGSISPDGRWFAVPTGRTEYATMTDSFYNIQEFHVYSTDGRRSDHIIEWEGLFRGGGTYAIPIIQWISDTSFLYSATDHTLDRKPYEFSPFTGDRLLYEGFYQPMYGDIGLSVPHRSRISPDRQLWVDSVDENSGTSLRFINITNETDTLTGDTVYQSFFWQPDSSQVVTVINQQTILFDRDGNKVDTIVDGYTHRFQWQIEGNEFALTDIEGKLLIGNATNQQLIDPCMMVTGFAWSPSGELAVSDGERISIINFEDGTHTIAAYHEGSVFDWRVPPEEE